MIALFIFLVISVSIFILGCYYDSIIIASIGTFCTGIVICTMIVVIEIKNTPSAIDVYRNKTTLEITYRDNIPVDSVVVFKN